MSWGPFTCHFHANPEVLEILNVQLTANRKDVKYHCMSALKRGFRFFRFIASVAIECA